MQTKFNLPPFKITEIGTGTAERNKSHGEEKTGGTEWSAAQVMKVDDFKSLLSKIDSSEGKSRSKHLIKSLDDALLQAEAESKKSATWPKVGSLGA